MMVEVVPPPWTLTGQGIIVLYRFPKQFVEPWLPLELRAKYTGGIGAVICVDYHTSNVGPYRELLFIPGMFALDRWPAASVTRIFVSSEASAVSGQVNWALPKQVAEFEVGSGMRYFSMSQSGEPVFRLALDEFGPYFPINTRWSPVQPWLGQLEDHSIVYTQPSGRGAIRVARVTHIWADGMRFPDVSQFRPLAAFLARGFTLTFPQPENKKGSEIRSGGAT